MSILIDMNMPDSCHNCPLCAFIPGEDDHKAFYYCVLSNWKQSCTPKPIEYAAVYQRRDSDCPIKAELPKKHGRLIDASNFDCISWKDVPEGYEDRFDDGVSWLAEQIDVAQVLLETEGEA